MRIVMLIVCSTCIWAQTAPPLERIIKGKPPVTANGTQDLQRFRSAVNGSRTVFQRGGASTVNQYNPLFGNAYGYLGGLEAGAVNPGRRQQLAYAYQDLGDLLGNPNGYNVGQQPLAIQCYQRAMYLMGNGGSSGDLESLAMRLTLLNAPFMMFGQDTRQRPAEPERPPVEVRATPGILMPPAIKTGEGPEAAEVREAYVAATGRGQALIGNVDEIRGSLGARGLTLHADIAGSLARMRLYFELAADSMANGAWSDAKRQIAKGDYEAGKLAKHVGR